ncbi:hypothetical protein OsccyDRAFT_0855 [Leptolyngbyaceae cyanobacterium JSC-12]|nr:hypothetical protein OsccyDRAFT_0855 [Leptolyngbyaceae cyanobacterium JSC-12]
MKLNIRRGRGGFAIWVNGLGFRLGTIYALYQFSQSNKPISGQMLPHGL